MREEEEWWHSKWWGPLFTAAFIGLALYFIIPNLPWIKQEIVENAIVVSKDGDTCKVETTSQWIVSVNECIGYNIGDNVRVRYRDHTSVGELIP